MSVYTHKAHPYHEQGIKGFERSLTLAELKSGWHHCPQYNWQAVKKSEADCKCPCPWYSPFGLDDSYRRPSHGRKGTERRV